MKLKLAVGVSVLLAAAPARAVIIDWGRLESTSGNVANASQVEGAPNNLAANLFPTPQPGSVTTSPTGASVSYDSSALAVLLGVSPALLQTVDVLAFDRNPIPMGGVGFEDSL